MRVVAFSGLRRDRKAISFIGVALLFGGYAAGTLCNFEIQAGVGREFIAKKAGERLAFSVDDVGGLLLMQSAILTAASWLGSLPKTSAQLRRYCSRAYGEYGDRGTVIQGLLRK
jgi:formate hydrogenlyase subunit 3/multisubunit Na+/H+ antiporter MnhD subunit